MIIEFENVVVSKAVFIRPVSCVVAVGESRILQSRGLGEPCDEAPSGWARAALGLPPPSPPAPGMSSVTELLDWEVKPAPRSPCRGPQNGLGREGGFSAERWYLAVSWCCSLASVRSSPGVPCATLSRALAAPVAVGPSQGRPVWYHGLAKQPLLVLAGQSSVRAQQCPCQLQGWGGQETSGAAASAGLHIRIVSGHSPSVLPTRSWARPGLRGTLLSSQAGQCFLGGRERSSCCWRHAAAGHREPRPAGASMCR